MLTRTGQVGYRCSCLSSGFWPWEGRDFLECCKPETTAPWRPKSPKLSWAPGSQTTGLAGPRHQLALCRRPSSPEQVERGGQEASTKED